MLSFRLEINDLASAWTSSPAGWRVGQSYIQPYHHSALQSYAITDDTRVLIVVSERLRGESSRWATNDFQMTRVTAQDLSAELENCGKWPLDFIMMLISNRGDGSEVNFHAGGWGTAPVYVLKTGDVLWGHWDPSELYPHTRNKTLDPVLVAHFLIKHGCDYSRQTLFPEIRLLTERSRTRWAVRDGQAGEVEIQYPPAAEPWRPRSLKSGADVLGAFKDILTSSMRRWMTDDEEPFSAELSSGLDTGMVAVLGAELTPHPVQTYGLIMPGEPGRLQQERRNELIERFGFIDRPVIAEDHPPLSSGSRVRQNHIVPGHEFYYEAFEAMLKVASAHGTKKLFSGNGGDELCSPYANEWSVEQREQRRRDVMAERADVPEFISNRTYESFRDTVYTIDRAPRAPIPVSGLTSANAAAPLYLGNGIWPVNPLCTPELVRFCRSLPSEWRAGRSLQRKFMKYLGCSDAYAYPKSTETFIPVAQLAMRRNARPLFHELFENSRLAEMGFVNREKLLSSYAEYCANEAQEVPDAEEGFYSVAVLELTLRALQGEAPASQSITAAKS